MEITISLPDEVFATVANLASKTHRRIDEIIVEKIEREFSKESETERPLLNFTDEEVLALANMKMSELENQRMSELLDKKKSGTLKNLEKNELEVFLRFYQMGNLRKSQGIAEAVLRGLIKNSDDLK